MAEEKTHRNKKVLFIASAASHIINFHNIYFPYLTGMGFEVHTATGINSSDNSDTDLINAEKTYTLVFEKGIKFLKNIITVFKLAKIIRREKYDIISTHSMLAGFIGRIAVMFAFIRKKKIRVIHTCHGYLFNDDRSFKSKLMIFIEKFLSLRTDILFVMNNDDFDIAKKYKLCKKIELIDGMGIDVEKLNKEKKDDVDIIEVGKKYSIPKDKKYFLCVGEFSKRKNQKNIIQAFSKFIRSLPDDLYHSYHMIFLGDGVLSGECRKLCETLGITGHVTFCGYVGETLIFYKYFAYCVVSASKFEGLPFNIMEALYCGKPVIASNAKGHKDLISDGFNGYLYEYDDDVKLAELFERASDTDVYENLRNNVLLAEKYYFDNVKEKILNCYNCYKDMLS